MRRTNVSVTESELFDIFLILFLGGLVGGHLGYLFFYRPEILFIDPVSFFLPYSPETGAWIGISGMSFHGGVIGVIIALFFALRKRKGDFLPFADLIALSAPIALFFGRIGNFLNQELPGRMTEFSFGMYFPNMLPSGALRHPSSLYEALGEGVLLFLTLFFLSRRHLLPGRLAASFLLCYAVIRFVLEYLREPDQGVTLSWGILTRGQFLSLILFICGAAFFIWLGEKNRGKMTV